jgi:zinc transport system substrate-binding protein
MNRAASHCAWQLLCALLMFASANADAAGRATIVASIRPLALIVRAIGRDALDIAVLPGVESSPHDFVLRPSALERIADAQLLVWMGPAMERPLAGVIARLDAAQTLALQPRLQAAESDPHLWVDPRGARALAQAIGVELRARRLLDETALAQHLAEFDTAMQLREQAMSAGFAGLEKVPFATLHDGLGPLVRRFGLNQVGALPATHEQQPGARSVAALRRTLASSGAVCLFRERADRAELAATLAEGMRLRIVELDPLALAARDEAQGFDKFLAGLGRAIAACLRAGAAAEAPA